MMICATFLITGCSWFQSDPVEVSDDALFCDVERPRRFTQEELDWRSANAPANLRLDFSTNLTWDEECVDQGDTVTGTTSTTSGS